MARYRTASPWGPNQQFGVRRPERAVDLMGFNFEEFDELLAAGLEGEVAADPMAAAVDEMFSGRGPSGPTGGEYNPWDLEAPQQSATPRQAGIDPYRNVGDVLGGDIRTRVREAIEAVTSLEGGDAMEHLTRPGGASQVHDVVYYQLEEEVEFDLVGPELNDVVWEELDRYARSRGYVYNPTVTAGADTSGHVYYVRDPAARSYAVPPAVAAEGLGGLTDAQLDTEIAELEYNIRDGGWNLRREDPIEGVRARLEIAREERDNRNFGSAEDRLDYDMSGLSPADRILMEGHEGFPARSPEIPGLTGIPAARPQLPEVTGFPATVEPGPQNVGFPIPPMQGPQIVQSAGTNGTSPRQPPVSSVDFIDWLNRQRETARRPPLTPQEEQSVRDSMGGGAAQARGLTADQAFQMHRATSGIGQEELPLGDKTGKRWTPEESARGLAGVEGARDVLEGRVTPPPHPDEVRAPVGPQPEQGELDLNPEARSMDSAMLQDLFAQRAAGPEQGYAGWAGDLPGGSVDLVGNMVDSLQNMSNAERGILIAGLFAAGLIVVGSGGTLTPVGGAMAGAAGLMALNQ